MYKLNTLQRNVLITTDEVVFHGPTEQAIDARMIENSIIIAEERFIRPAIGFEFYEALVDEKNLTITSGNKAVQQTLIDAYYAAKPKATKPKELEAGDVINASEYMSPDNKALWNYILWKLASECVLLIALPEGFVQMSSQGAIHKQSTSGPMSGEGIVTPELRSMKWVMDKKLMDRIDPLRESMHQWLCRQKKADSSKYPDYKKYCDCDSNGVAFKRKSDIVLGIYDDPRGDYLDRRDPHVHPDCDCW